MESTIKILIVEDDPNINQLLCDIARNSGYFAQPAFSGTEAALYLEKEEWDLLLLDLMLPGLAGEAVLEKVSEKNSLPVIIISAKLEQQSKIESLRNGADDYITKPFDNEEVAARIDALLRRHQRTAAPPADLRHKDIVVDTEAKTVSVNGIEVILTSREYAILLLFLLAPKKVFTKANVYESVWGDVYRGDDNTINVHMSHLRSKLAKANPDEDYIETVWGMGYRLKS